MNGCKFLCAALVACCLAVSCGAPARAAPITVGDWKVYDTKHFDGEKFTLDATQDNAQATADHLEMGTPIRMFYTADVPTFSSVYGILHSSTDGSQVRLFTVVTYDYAVQIENREAQALIPTSGKWHLLLLVNSRLHDGDPIYLQAGFTRPVPEPSGATLGLIGLACCGLAALALGSKAVPDNRPSV